MKIGQFSDTFMPIVDGVGRVVYNYAVNLAALGHECYVVAPCGDTGYRGALPFEIIDYVGVPLISSPQYNIGVPILDKHYHERVSMVKFDIIHAHSPFIAGQEALRIANKLRIPLVGTFHSKYYDDFYSTTKSEMLSTLGVKYIVDFYERCDEVWAVSESSAQVLRDYGYKGGIVTMPNGTDIRTPADGAVAEVTEKFGLGEAPVLLFVGQMHWKKNILRILEAAKMLRESGCDFRLVMAGQGPCFDEIKAKAAKLDIDDVTVFTGHIADTRTLDAIYERASLFVFPSIYDNAPMVLREAAAMGTPAVVTEGSCAAEVVKDGFNGFTCPDSSEGLYETIRARLGDAEKLAAVGKNARETIPIAWRDILAGAAERYGELVRIDALSKKLTEAEN